MTSLETKNPNRHPTQRRKHIYVDWAMYYNDDILGKCPYDDQGGPPIAMNEQGGIQGMVQQYV